MTEEKFPYERRAVPRKDVLRDYVDRLLDAVDRHPQGFTEAVAREVEKNVRHDWGGERALIRKDPDREARRAQATLDLQRGEPVHKVMQTHGISRTRVYALFKKCN